MSDTSAIEWTDATWNPITGCTKVSPGCDNCYAIRFGARLQHLPAYAGTIADRDWTGKINLVHDRLDQPLRWAKPRRIFVNSMSDLFHPDVPVEFIDRVVAVMIQAPQHQFQVLTKRPKRMRRVLGSLELPNVWLGTSIEADRYTFRADHLRATPAAVRFLSLEPLLGPLPSLDLTGIDWVIVGGESGPKARPMHPDWVRDIRDRCVAAGVPFFFKQWGEWAKVDKAHATHLFHGNRPWLDEGYALIPIANGTTDHPYGVESGRNQDLVDRGHAGWVRVQRVGKKRAGRDLDGRTWDEYPHTIRLETEERQ